MQAVNESATRLEGVIRRLLSYCEAENWAGYDPYDALNSGLFRGMPFLDFRLARLCLTQGLKRMPFNPRPLLLIPKTQNAKGMALFLRSLLKLRHFGVVGETARINYVLDRIAAMRSPGVETWCWGYSFPWQTRTIVCPRGAPNVVCTTFVAGALLDAYESLGDGACLDMAASAGQYLVREVFWSEGDDVASFSYPLPNLKTRVHNANFLGGALLARLFKHTGLKEYRDTAMQVARYSASRQRADGSWDYGELPTQRWIDNFHTGYNLCALQDLGDALGTFEFDSHVRRGFDFYRAHFFREDGAPRYFHDRTYPIDAHCVAQSLITLSTFRDCHQGNMDLARAVFDWAMKHLWNERRGYFYYQVLPWGTKRTSFMRWTQAWMLLGLTLWFQANRSGSVNACRAASESVTPATP